MSLTFRQASALTEITRDDDVGTFAASVPETWEQGRGAFGGLVFGLLVRAATAMESDPARVLRTFSSDVAGPVLPGPARVRARVLRRGKGQTNLQVELEQAGAVQALANLTLSSERKSDAATPMPSAPPEASQPWAALPLLPVGPPMGPVFSKHYEYRNVGPFPLSNANEAVSAGFMREKAWQEDETGHYDGAAITALLDSYWPALFAVSKRAHVMTTVSFSSQYLNHHVPLPMSEPLFFRARALTQSEGYSVELRELWAKDQLIALNQQTFAILR